MAALLLRMLASRLSLAAALLLPTLAASGATDAGAILLIAGEARTFSCTFPSLVASLAKPLDADLFAYMKTDDGNATLAALQTYRRFVGAELVERLDDCDDACLLTSVRCRGRFAGSLANDTLLQSALRQARLLERAGDELRRLERERGRRYAWVAWARPDVAVDGSTLRRPLEGITQTSEWNRPCAGNVDRARVLPRDDAELLLASGMAAVRAACGDFGTDRCAHDRRAECWAYAREPADFFRGPRDVGCLDRAKPVGPRRCLNAG